MKNDVAVYIGRFQPFHNGHLATVVQALKEAKRLIIALGSANKASDPKNPWDPAQRQAMITEAIGPDNMGRIDFIEIRDYFYDDNRWVTEVQTKVQALAGHDAQIALIGYHKDASSYYL